MVAGHSSYTWSTHYDTKAVEATQILVSALQEKRDTVGPLIKLNLPKRSLEEDMVKRMDELRKVKKKRSKKRRGILSDSCLEKLSSAIAVVDPTIFAVRSTNLRKDGARNFKAMCHNSLEGIGVRYALKDSLIVESNEVVKFTTSKAFKKLRAGKELKDSDVDVLHQVILSMYSSIKKK